MPALWLLHGLLLLGSVLVGLLAVYASLLSGASPLLVWAAVFAWVLVLWSCFRLSRSGETLWQKALPSFVLILNIAYGYWTYNHVRERVMTTEKPRRYYSWDDEK